eukprot:Trichotokara_eunicae@DN3615_c0_g1_i2.p2
MVQYPDEPIYSEKYADDYYEYRHVILTRPMCHEVKSLSNRKGGSLLAESEWRRIGVQQSRGWQHFMRHAPEPHVLLFRRALHTDPLTGKPAPEWKPPNDARGRLEID